MPNFSMGREDLTSVVDVDWLSKSGPTGCVQGIPTYESVKEQLTSTNQAQTDSFKAYADGLLDNASQALSGDGSATKGLTGVDLGDNFVITVKGKDNISVDSNVLNEYLNVQYHISLSMIPENYCRNLQTGNIDSSIDIDIDTLKSKFSSLSIIPIASTGEELRQNSTDNRNYYSITSMELENILAPSPNNPMLSNMISMKMTLSEPYGFKLSEDLRAIADSIGYKGLPLARCLYRVDIFYSGYNPSTGAWVRQIPLNNTPDGVVKLITYYMAISNVEATVNENGTTYDLSMVIRGNAAYRPEDFVLDGGLPVECGESNTFGGFVQDLSKKLYEARLRTTNQKIVRYYEFIVPNTLLNAKFDTSLFASKRNNSNMDDNHVVQVADVTDIVTLLQNTLNDLKVVQDLFIADQDNDEFTKPRVHFTVRFNAIYGNKVTSPATKDGGGTGDYDSLTLQYIIEPFITFKAATYTKTNIDVMTTPTAQLNRIQRLMQLGMFTRQYDYLFTGLNTEVVEFNLRMSMFYLATIDSGIDLTSNMGVGQTATPDTVKQQRDIKESTDIKNTQTVIQDSNGNALPVGTLAASLVGSGTTTTRTKNGLEVINGSFNERPFNENTPGSIAGAGNPRRSQYQQLFDTHLKYDLLVIDDLQVRGDPVWLLSPYASQNYDNISSVASTKITRSPSSQPLQSTTVIPSTGRTIFLRLYAPNQELYMNDVAYQNKASFNKSVIGGFYEILKVNSKFSDGLFVQTMTAQKMNHLNYVDEYFKGFSNGQPIGVNK